MGKRKTRIITVCVSLFVIIAITFGLMYWAIDKLTPLDKDRAERYFNRDKEDILLVTQYFVNSGYSNILIHDANGNISIGYNSLMITDETVKKAVNNLIDKRGYISMERTDNTISFAMWCRLSDVSRGIAYSIDKEHEPTLEYLTELEPLEEDGWYYYEDDYNEWRVRYK